MLKEYLVFDIETAPIEWDTLAESQQEYLLRNAQTEEEIEKRKFEMALTPMTAHVVCIGLQMMKQQEDGTYEMTSRAAFSSVPDSVYEENKDIELSTGAHCYIRREEKVLTDFWAILTKYPRACLISFNGRNFDAPFLMLRSALLGIKPSRNLMAGTKFNYQGHIDLIDELTFYAGSQYGATTPIQFRLLYTCIRIGFAKGRRCGRIDGWRTLPRRQSGCDCRILPARCECNLGII